MESVIASFACSTVSYDPELRLGLVVWKGTPDFEEYKKPFMCLLDYADSHPIENFYSDVIQQGAVPVEFRKWFESEMVPAAKAKGLQRTVIITTDNPLKKYYLNMLLIVVNKFDIPIRIFSTKEQALGWIKNELVAV